MPSNIILRIMGSANWLAFIAFFWGTVMMAQVWTTGLLRKDRAAAHPSVSRDLFRIIESWQPVELSSAYLEQVRLFQIHPALFGNSDTRLGLFPGCIYLVSCWYVRYEVQIR